MEDGIKDAKKAMLDKMVVEVAAAQYEVEKYKAKVASLTQKTDNCRLHLSDAELMHSKAKDNKGLFDQLLQQVADLQSQAETASTGMVGAADKTNELFKELNIVVQKLVYTASLINKLSDLITRSKAVNPLISDDLVSRAAAAVADANNAVTLTLIAFKTTNLTCVSNAQTLSVVKLTRELSESLKDSFTGTTTGSTAALLKEMCNSTEMYHKRSQTRLDESTSHLNEALEQLNKTELKLKSLQAGLSAAGAASLAT